MAFNLIEKINKLSKREKNIVGILLITVSSLPFINKTLPEWNNYINAVSKIREDKRRLSDADIQIRRLEKYKNQNTDLAKKVETQRLYLAKSYEVDFLVEDLKKLCDESSISLESFTPGDAEPVNIILDKQIEAEAQNKESRLREVGEKLKGQELPVDLYRFPIEVKVTGDFADIVELFRKLERYGRVISVENISVGKLQLNEGGGNRLSRSKPKSQSQDTGTLLSTFDLVAYSLPKADEKLPFSELGKKIHTSPKTTFKFKRKRT